LHCNEIVLLAYYIAAINIEESYHFLAGGEYQPFNGIVLTDTFQMFENAGYLLESIFPENNQRVINQKQRDITVIIGNPPYSAGQTSENDGNKNLKYENLDKRIADTYAKYSTATLKNKLYDSYIRSFRWASDRIKDKGIICFVSNGSFIDKGFADGLRKCLVDEFTNIYCFNLRGFIRGQSGDDAKKEGQNIFNIMTGVAIIVLIKNPDNKPSAKVKYYDIGDFLTRVQKLTIIEQLTDISTINWQELTPNNSYDWINQRNVTFEFFISLGDKKGNEDKTIFDGYSNGILTSRDAWIYNFSNQLVIDNMIRMIEFYNSQIQAYQLSKGEKTTVEKFINTDSQKINWSRSLKKDFSKLIEHKFDKNSVIKGSYRPFCKQWMYFNKGFNEEVYQIPRFFPNQNLENLVICVTGIGARRDF
jgi:predicted helicase